MATHGNPLRYNSLRSSPPVSALAHSRKSGARQAHLLYHLTPYAISQSPHGFSVETSFSLIFPCSSFSQPEHVWFNPTCARIRRFKRVVRVLNGPFRRLATNSDRFLPGEKIGLCGLIRVWIRKNRERAHPEFSLSRVTRREWVGRERERERELSLTKPEKPYQAKKMWKNNETIGFPASGQKKPLGRTPPRSGPTFSCNTIQIYNISDLQKTLLFVLHLVKTQLYFILDSTVYQTLKSRKREIHKTHYLPGHFYIRPAAIWNRKLGFLSKLLHLQVKWHSLTIGISISNLNDQWCKHTYAGPAHGKLITWMK